MSDDADQERLQLHGFDRVVYFAPTLFVAYLASLCALLTLLALLFVTLPNPAALVGAGLFGLIVTLGLCALLYHAQQRELRYVSLPTVSDAERNYQIVLQAAQAAGWLVARKLPAQLIEVRIAGSFLTLGELLVARFDGNDVRVAAISDPRVGYSMTGRERCRQHVELLRLALRRAGAGAEATPP
ncbi:MAG: hypothetical protein JWR16_2523 [Nevskia sp.]|nr:hypothetical protein [Nevskia sp.]